MNTHPPLNTAPAWPARWTRWLFALTAVLAVVAGCGGGVGVGGTGSYASGPISGFGSVIVNGIEFSDDTARVEDEDGAQSSRSALRLGMYTEIDGSALAGSTDAPTAVATRIRFSSEIVGPVSAVNAADGTLTVFGQSVTVNAATVLDESFTGGLAGVAVGQGVEVYGFYDPSNLGSFVATRIEPRSGTLTFYKLRGLVRNFNAGTKTFGIGGLVFDYSAAAAAGAAANLPANLGNGSFVRVRVATTPNASGQWTVLSLVSALRSLPDLDRVRLRSSVTSIDSPTQFSVNGQPVDASQVPAVTGLVLGARVDVEGAIVAGVLRATKVSVDSSGGAQAGFELKGPVAEPVRPVLQTFVLRGVTVYYGLGNPFETGAAAGIVAGARVEVRGVLSADGTRLVATRIRFVN